MPKISIVVPIFNVEKYLSSCLDCLTKQTMEDVEIICVDDGSTDSSSLILREYANRDSRIKILQQENKGAGAARNYGLSVAQGEYLMFLDSDDLFDVHMCEAMYKEAKSQDLDVLVCRADRFDINSEAVIPCPWTVKTNLLPEKCPFTCYDIQKDFFSVFVWWPWDKIYKKSFIDDLGILFQELRNTEDLFFVCAATIAAQRVSYINNVFVHQRIGRKDSISVTREKHWDDFLKALVKLRDFMSEKGIYARFERDFVNYCLDFSLWHLDTLRGYSYCLLYNALKNIWYKNFGVSTREREYFYNVESYNRMVDIVERDVSQVLCDKLDAASREASSLKKQNSVLDGECQTLRKDLQAIRKSVSFRVGRGLTYLPRMVRDRLKAKKGVG